jgi:hypothetical protein
MAVKRIFFSTILRESLDIWYTLLTLACGIPRAPLLIYLAIPIQTTSVAK